MWYFSWILGLGLALTFGVLNALWFEMSEFDDRGAGPTGTGADPYGVAAVAPSEGNVTRKTEPAGRLG